MIFESPGPEQLTTREIEVLTALVNGKSTKQIAVEYGIKTATVLSHLNRVRGKLRAKTREEAVYKAILLGLIRIPTQY